VRRRWIAGAALILAAATACSTSHNISIGPGPTGPNPSLTKLVAAAHLRPCPPSSSSAAAVSGGLPNVTLPCLGKGPVVHMSGLMGKPTVVNIWAEWCIPCQAEARFLASAYDTLHAKVDFLGVDTQDQASKALSFGTAVSPPVRYPSVFDPDKKVMLDLHFPGPPETLLVNSAGRIVHIHRGQYFSAAAVEADISTYLHVSA
jgi:cytochrome c biogenesis protein CcmG/thiol:disulfide interchange protein DsbE